MEEDITVQNIKNNNKNNKNKNVWVITLCVVIVICLGVGLHTFLEAGRSTIINKTKVTEVPVVTLEPSNQPESTVIPVEETKEPVVLEQYKELLEINPEVVGMITIPDTKVLSYPVLIGADNEYYLEHDINKEKSIYGSIYVDYLYRNDNIGKAFLRHTLIYGHNMKDNSMFGEVVEYKKKEFFDTHEYIYFDNLYETGKWKVFSVYVVDADKETIERKFDTEETYLEFIKRIQLRSKFKVDLSLTAEDEIITLCTCSYETENSRTIVHAVKVDE